MLPMTFVVEMKALVVFVMAQCQPFGQAAQPALIGQRLPFHADIIMYQNKLSLHSNRFIVNKTEITRIKKKNNKKKKTLCTGEGTKFNNKLNKSNKIQTIL